MKDRAIAFALKKFWNMKFEKVGKIEKLFIDTKAKRIYLELSLKGESEPVSIEIVRYRIEDEKLYIEKIQASKEWIEGIFELVGQKGFRLPPQVAHYLKMLL
jgi:hypothetical protein